MRTQDRRKARWIGGSVALTLVSLAVLVSGCAMLPVPVGFPQSDPMPMSGTEMAVDLTGAFPAAVLASDVGGDLGLSVSSDYGGVGVGVSAWGAGRKGWQKGEQAVGAGSLRVDVAVPLRSRYAFLPPGRATEAEADALGYYEAPESEPWPYRSPLYLRLSASVTGFYRKAWPDPPRESGGDGWGFPDYPTPHDSTGVAPFFSLGISGGPGNGDHGGMFGAMVGFGFPRYLGEEASSAIEDWFMVVGGDGGGRWSIADEAYFVVRGGGFLQGWPNSTTAEWGNFGVGLRLTLGFEWGV